MAKKESVIKLDGVEKIYTMGDTLVRACDGINLEIYKGEFVAIIGPSGSGKSTLMHLIGLLDKPTSGNIFLNDRDISKIDDNELAHLRNQNIGFVFQSFNLLARTSALDNCEIPLLYAGVLKKERDERAIAALTMVGLGERLDHFPSQLSGGQQQRVAIARALINNPSLILADEPTGNLDSRSGTEIMKLLKELNDQGNTIVLVTHELDIARGAKRIIEIRDGKVVGDKINGHKI